MPLNELKETNIKGLIEYFNLINFWKKLSANQQEYLRNEFNSGLGVNPKSLIDINIESSNQTKLSFLRTFLQSPRVDSDEILFEKLINQAELAISECNEILDIHFYLQAIITYYYRKRKKTEDFYNLAKESCLRQIKIAEETKNSFIKDFGKTLPSHYGYKQYSIILQKEKKYKEAISICSLALEQGWNGDWEKRIERLKTTANTVQN